MADPDKIAQAIAKAEDWNTRVALVRRIPEEFGRAHLREVYAAVSERAYVPHLTPDFAYVYHREDYDLSVVEEAVRAAAVMTANFTAVTVAHLEHALRERPTSMRCFRLIIGYTPQEMAAATAPVAASLTLPAVGVTAVKNLEQGRAQGGQILKVLAETISRAVAKELFPPAAEGLRSKQERPDLVDGWATVRELFHHGVRYSMFLHQRHYGGAFRQLLDATSSMRGNILEDAVEQLFDAANIPAIRTGSANQAEIARRFHLTVQPAPDFVVYDSNDSLRALLECKLVNDGGTARDKAARFSALREAAKQHGGVPVFAVLGGLGWTRTNDALGPVVQHCDGRVFTLSTLQEMLTVDPFPALTF
ncbi:hypothetical protein [Micromonospora aurantiaca (nom. illeg.)]|uniref:hypothetical protein n=1 Tax=Micromonospora aurantiaca (nom. illeg.) TaxID=47850 RepID=UPI001656A212|nr:hypothetical protein [Micromonospora aurantiaca]MBC9005109.1 hypothetical protein [Micromonospora aurantiaca]